MPGDWKCGSCMQANFYDTRACRRCNEPFVGPSRNLSFGASSRVPNFRPGDWYCTVLICRHHNFGSRRFCQRCGAPRNRSSFVGTGYYNPVYAPMNFGFNGRRFDGRISRRGWKPGDWFCGRPECNAHNYSYRVKCFKCNSSRELVSNVSS